jgi:hypothetical protein
VIETFMMIVKFFRLLRRGFVLLRATVFIATVAWALSHSLSSCSTIRTDVLVSR